MTTPYLDAIVHRVHRSHIICDVLNIRRGILIVAISYVDLLKAPGMWFAKVVSPHTNLVSKVALRLEFFDDHH